MAATVGYAVLEVIPSLKGIQGNLNNQLRGQMPAIGKQAGSHMADGMRTTMFGSAKRIFAPLAAGFGAVQAANFLKGAVGEASDLGESLNALQVTYGKNAAGIQKLGRAAADSLGLSNVEFNNLAVRFSGFSKTITGDSGSVVKTLDDLTGRAADFASVMNIEVAKAAELFQSGLAGETEPLRQFGIDLSAAAVEAHAYKTGIAEAGEELSENQKVQARYSLLMRRTAKTQGDFANTSDSLANSQRRLSAQWDNVEAQLGKALLPALEDVSGWMANEGVPAFSKFIRQMRNGKGAGGDFADILGDIKGVAEDVAPVVKDIVSAFNDMPSWAKKGLIGGGAGLLAANKLGILGTGKGGGIGGLISKATPMPVFVTNPGFGAGLPGAGGGGVGGGKGGKVPGPLGGGAGGMKGLGIFQYLGFAGGALGTSTTTKHPVTGEELLGRDAFKTAAAFPDLGNFRDGLRDTIGLLNDYASRINSLPKAVQTAIAAPGAVESGRDVARLAEKYDLTPRQITTVIAQSGVDLTKNQVNSLVERYELTEKTREALLKAVDRASPIANNAKTALERFKGIYEATMITRRVTIYENRRGGVTSSTGGRSAETINQAAGGYIRGPGTATSDSIPAMLSNGEYVVRAAAVDAYGVDMLHRINAMRFADGGPVGGGRSGRGDRRRDDREDRDRRKHREQMRRLAEKQLDETRGILGATRDLRSTVADNFRVDPFTTNATLPGVLASLGYDTTRAGAFRSAARNAKRLGLNGAVFQALLASGNTAVLEDIDTRGDVRALEAAWAARNKATTGLDFGAASGGQTVKELKKSIDRLEDRLKRLSKDVKDGVRDGARQGTRQGAKEGTDKTRKRDGQKRRQSARGGNRP